MSVVHETPGELISFSIHRKVTNFTPFLIANFGTEMAIRLEDRPGDLEVYSRYFKHPDRLIIPVLRSTEVTGFMQAYGINAEQGNLEAAETFVWERLGHSIRDTELRVNTLPAKWTISRRRDEAAGIYIARSQEVFRQQQLARTALMDFYGIVQINSGVWASQEKTGALLGATKRKGSSKLAKLGAMLLNDMPDLLPSKTDSTAMILEEIRHKTT
jgi:hypothetical protein